MDNNEIGKQIRIERFRKEMTQQELANKIGVTWEMVSRYERGESSPLQRIDAIAKALDTTPAQLLQSDYTSSQIRDRADMLIPIFKEIPENSDFSPHNTHSYYNAPEWIIKRDKESFAVEPELLKTQPVRIDKSGPIYVSPNDKKGDLVLLIEGKDLKIATSENISKKAKVLGTILAQERRFS